MKQPPTFFFYCFRFKICPYYSTVGESYPEQHSVITDHNNVIIEKWESRLQQSCVTTHPEAPFWASRLAMSRFRADWRLWDAQQQNARPLCPADTPRGCEGWNMHHDTLCAGSSASHKPCTQIKPLLNMDTVSWKYEAIGVPKNIARQQHNSTFFVLMISTG